MKKIIFIIIGLALMTALPAQNRAPDDLDIIQSIFGKDKKELAQVYMNLQGETAATLSKESLNNIKNIDKLHEKYFNKMKKADMQMDVYIQRIVEAEVLNDIPFIGEMDNLKK